MWFKMATSCTLGSMSKLWLLKTALLVALFLGVSGCEMKSGKEAGFLIQKQCKYDIDRSIRRLKSALVEANLTLFGIIDHSANAKKVGLDLKPNRVVTFGSPDVGTLLMQCNPTMGLDLPMRFAFHTDYEGITTLTYTTPEYWSIKHNIKDKRCLKALQKLSIGLDMLSDKVAKE